MEYFKTLSNISFIKTQLEHHNRNRKTYLQKHRITLQIDTVECMRSTVVP